MTRGIYLLLLLGLAMTGLGQKLMAPGTTMELQPNEARALAVRAQHLQLRKQQIEQMQQALATEEQDYADIEQKLRAEYGMPDDSVFSPDLTHIIAGSGKKLAQPPPVRRR